MQKVILRLIFQWKGKAYSKFLANTNIEKLVTRRKRLLLNFVKKALQHEKFKSWFDRSDNFTKYMRASFKDSITRTKKQMKSPIPYLTSLLNANNGRL